MRLGYVLEQFPKLSETFILDEMLEMERLGLDLTVFSLSNPNETKVHEKVALLRSEVFRPFALPIPALRPPDIRFLPSVGPKKWLWGAKTSSWLANIAKERGIDHLHAHFAGDAAFIAMLSSKLSNIPYSFSVHAGGIFGWPYLIKEKIAGAKYVVSISEFNRRYLIEKYCLGDADAKKINIVHCGIDLDQFVMSQRARESGRRGYNILTVARLEEKKGHRYLLEALKILRDRRIDFRANIVGGGFLERELKGLARSLGLEDCLEFLGPRTMREIQKFLDGADVFVLPCVRAKNGNMDGIPVSLMEAMAAGVPVVSTKLSGIPELVENGEEGLLVEPQNSVEIAAAVERILLDPDLWRSFAVKARAKIESGFDVKKNAEELQRFLLR